MTQALTRDLVDRHNPPARTRALGRASALTAFALLVALAGDARAQERTQITVQAARPKQEFEGLGAGAIFYEGHITSLAARDKKEKQEQLFDDMFTRVSSQYLQLMIRETHEPKNDNDDPYTPAFEEKNFEYCKHTIAIAKAALKRQPKIQLYATLYTPPPWMKTNNDVSAGGKVRATLKPNMELELAEYVWAFLAHMQKNGVPVQYLSICNEPDWPHEQPGYCLTADQHAALIKVVGEYLDKMAKKYPDVPRVKLVGPNTLSAPGAVKEFVPAMLKSAGKYIDVIGTHDYDPRGDRWGGLRKLAGKRPVWLTEWCARKKDASPGMIDSATEYGVAMHEAFTGGANVFMAYDWVYPPRDSGEALIHVKWGDNYLLTKPYHLFRQWAEPLKPGMKVVEVSVAGKVAGLKPTAFLAPEDRALIVHVVNANDKEAPINLKLTGKFATATTAERTRTSATEDVKAQPALNGKAGSFIDTLPARSMVTYRFEGLSK
jgi:O-glycosyl hydrolase